MSKCDTCIGCQYRQRGFTYWLGFFSFSNIDWSKCNHPITVAAVGEPISCDFLSKPTDMEKVDDIKKCLEKNRSNIQHKIQYPILYRCGILGEKQYYTKKEPFFKFTWG